MNVCISLAEHETQMAHRWFDFVCELGGTDGHSLYLIPTAGVNVSTIIPKATKAFGGRFTLIKDEESQTSDWQSSEVLRSAAGPNSAFRQIAWHFYHGKLGPYFWCELDCVPLRKDWINILEAEYKSCGKPFMGAHVQIENVPEHMSGNGVYVNVPEEAPGLIQRTNWTPQGQERSFELAFDISGARDVLPKAHFTNLIQHKFRFKGFESRAEFDAVIDKNAVVFHSDKAGTIYKYLRENLKGGDAILKTTSATVTSEDSTESTRTGVVPSSNAAPTVRSTSAATPVPEPHLIEDNSRKVWESSIRKDYVSSCETTVVNKTFTPDDELKAIIAKNSVIKHGLPSMSPPWENREDTERDIKMLCDTLKLFCGAPVYKGRVREALREAKIIK